MGTKDIKTKLLTRNNEVFAELFNTFIFKHDVIDPEKLQEKDSSEISAIFPGNKTKQNYRDVLKDAQIKVDDSFAYLLLGIENQSDIHYAMPVRTMMYDALNYSNQVDQIGKKLRKQKNSSLSQTEWLSRFPKGAIIKPVITMVLCWSPSRWDGPKSLYDLMDKNVIRYYGKYIDNYKIHLISVRELPDSTLQRMKSEIGLALEFAKYSDNKFKIREFMNDVRFTSRSNEFISTINLMTGQQLQLNEHGGLVDMCKGLDDLCNDYKEEGRVEGISEGRINLLNEMVYDNQLSVSYAAKKAKMKLSAFKKQYDDYLKRSLLES